MKEQKCSKCGEKKPINRFLRDKRYTTKVVYRTTCLDCQPADQKVADKKGKKSVPWYEDPDILLTLDLVDSMDLEGARPYQIARAIGVSWDTAKRYVEHVKELRLMASGTTAKEKKNASIAQWEHIRLHAWSNFRTNKDVKFLREAANAQHNIDLIEGNHAPKKVEVGIVVLSDEAQKALLLLESMGIKPEDIYREFESSIIETAYRQKNMIIENTRREMVMIDGSS